MPLELTPEVSVGDILTALSVLFSAGSFIYVQITTDRKRREQEVRLTRIDTVREIAKQLSQARFDLNIAFRAQHFGFKHDAVRDPVHAFFDLKDYVDSVAESQLAAANLIDRATFGRDHSARPTEEGSVARISEVFQQLERELDAVNEQLKEGALGTPPNLRWPSIEKAEAALDLLVHELVDYARTL